MPKRKKAPTKQKQKQSQRQSVVVNIGTSKGKSKPRKSSGRGGLPPPSYQHNLAPTFITAPQVDYAPVIGAIAGLTARLQPEPRIENPVTPLSSSTSYSAEQAQQMAGQKAEERRAGHTAGNFQSMSADRIAFEEWKRKKEMDKLAEQFNRENPPPPKEKRPYVRKIKIAKPESNFVPATQSRSEALDVPNPTPEAITEEKKTTPKNVEDLQKRKQKKKVERNKPI